MSKKFNDFKPKSPFDASPTPIDWQELLLPPSPIGEFCVQCFNSDTFDCDYLPGQRERLQTLHIAAEAAPFGWGALTREGFRRSGQMIYRPHCPDCRACQSLRVCAMEFVPTRSQRRAWAAHAPRLSACALPLHASAEHFALYGRYQSARHAGSSMEGAGIDDYRDFIAASPVRSVLIEFRDRLAAEQPRPKGAVFALGVRGEQDGFQGANTDNGGLISSPISSPVRMVSLIDITDDGISAVYTFFDPDFGAGLGTYGILWQIGLARRLNMPFVYLGYFIEAVQNMRYKQNFYPHQIFINQNWVQWLDPAPKSAQNHWDFPDHDFDRLNNI